MANVFEPHFDDGEGRSGFSYRRARIGWQAGSDRLGASLYEVPPGQATFPYHWHTANEELVVVLAGRPSLRTPEGWRELSPGEVAAFRTGEPGAHQVVNRSENPVRFLMVSEMNAPEMSIYPDTDKVGVLDRAPGTRAEAGERSYFFRTGEATDYWEGESPPEAEA